MRQDWQQIRIGDACKTGAGGTPLKSKKEYYLDGKIPWLQSGEVSQGEIFKSKKFISESGLKNSSAKLFPANTVLVAMYGATAGQVGILRFEASTNQAVCGIFPNPNLLPEFIYYALLERQSDLIATAAGNAQPNISQIKVKNTEIPLPPLPEQKRIVAILDEAFEGIDAAIANTQKNLANARELFESYLNEVFTKKGEGWEEIPVSEFATVYDGPHATPKTVEEGPLFLGITSLQDGSLNLDKTRHVTEEDFKKWTRRVVPKYGDVVFSYETRLGQAAIIPEGMKCCLGRRMGLVRINNNRVIPEFFLYQYLSPSFRSFLDSKTVRGATVDRIPLKLFPTFCVFVPSRKEQITIVETIRSMALESKSLETIYHQKLDSLDELKQSLLAKAFSGELTADSEQVLKEAVG